MTSTPVRLDFRSGGVWLLLAAVLCLVVVGTWMQRLRGRPPVIGDGRDVASYQFDLSTCLVPRETLVPAGFPRDGVPAMTRPEVLDRAGLAKCTEQLRRAHQGKLLVDSDLVIGVAMGGEARAYPIRMITWHEIVNDVLGGVPIAVTYHPLCDSSVVFDRRVGGETLEFGVSGLLFNSNLLMYDRRPGRQGESLWSQLLFRAVAGPAAARGATLALVPAVVVHWSDWLERHPDTTVLAPDRARMRAYRSSYGSYFASPELRYPAEPLPEDGRPLKEPWIALRAGEAWHAFPRQELIARADAQGNASLELEGVEIEYHVRADPPAIWPVRGDGRPVDVVPALHFAWYAFRHVPVRPERQTAATTKPPA